MKSSISPLINLASSKLGSYGYKANDEFFAPLSRMLLDSEPIFVPDKYDNHGKWMDGWETRRRRTPGFDWCLIKLGCTGVIKKIDVNTQYFTGNYPPYVSLEGINTNTIPNENDKEWTSILKKTKVSGDSSNIFLSKNKNIYNWVMLKIYPDGGIARLRLWGDVFKDWKKVSKNKTLELSALYNCGKIISYNNAHYGDVTAILSNGRGKNMGDGWETRRRRNLGNDWLIIELGNKGYLKEVEVDTAFFKGNYPESCSIDAALINSKFKTLNQIKWENIIPKTTLEADKIHKIKIREALSLKRFSHVRLNIYPDGGVSRFRVFGHI